ncbi:MAG: molybdopterin-guanine dinucleotide biosynthesis protein B [Betaproteobacteria bacterium]|nr:molybdopterin-guanine dinucleotide biosynthesis protein B [Betaproteobacteria bacterium]
MKVFGFAGWSGSGKTTLIEQLIPRFAARGLSVSLIKHAHHQFDVDRPGKDSYRHRHAGCTEVMVTSDVRWALMHEMRGGREQTLDEQIERMTPVDLLLIEGWKSQPLHKLEVYRQANAKPLLYPNDAYIVAVASDVPVPTKLPRFEIHDYERIAQFVLEATELK